MEHDGTPKQEVRKSQNRKQQLKGPEVTVFPVFQTPINCGVRISGSELRSSQQSSQISAPMDPVKLPPARGDEISRPWSRDSHRRGATHQQ